MCLYVLVVQGPDRGLQAVRDGTGRFASGPASFLSPVQIVQPLRAHIASSSACSDKSRASTLCCADRGGLGRFRFVCPSFDQFFQCSLEIFSDRVETASVCVRTNRNDKVKVFRTGQLQYGGAKTAFQSIASWRTPQPARRGKPDLALTRQSDQPAKVPLDSLPLLVNLVESRLSQPVFNGSAALGLSPSAV